MEKKIVVDECKACPSIEQCGLLYVGAGINEHCPLPDDREDELRTALKKLSSYFVKGLTPMGNPVYFETATIRSADFFRIYDKALGKEA
jgi:hypothetical protein